MKPLVGSWLNDSDAASQFYEMTGEVREFTEPGRHLRVLDLFAGLGGGTLGFAERGHEVVTVDLDPRFGTDVVADLFDLSASDLPGPWDFVWASPPCEKFSVLTIGKNWTRDHQPKTEGAALARELVRHTAKLIADLDPAFFVMENPCGKLRTLVRVGQVPEMEVWERRTVTYCSYGAPWQKRTDLWGGFPPALVLRPGCSNDNPCSEWTRKAKPNGPRKDAEKRYGAYPARHGEISDNGGLAPEGHVAPPRGSRTSVQGGSVTAGDDLPSPRNTQTAINDRATQHPLVTAWEGEMLRIVEGNRALREQATTNVLEARYGGKHVGVADVLAGGSYRKPRRDAAAAQNNGDKSVSRSAIRAMVPPDLSRAVALAVEFDRAALRTRHVAPEGRLFG